jgi:MFS family permease
VVFALVAWIVPASVLRTAGRFDFVGAAGLVAGLLGVLLAISRGSEWGWTSPAVLILGLAGLGILVLWGWYELRVPAPLLDLRVAARRPVLLTNLASVAMGFALFSSNVAYPQLLELPVSTGVGLGLSLLAASFVVMPSGIVMMVLSPLSGRLARTLGPRVLLVAGAVALIVAYGFSLLLSSEVWHILVANILIGFGIGFGYAAMPMLIMRSVPHTETGASNGLNALARSVGTSTAAAIVGAVLAAMSVDQGGTQLPTAAAFQTTFLLGGAAAIVALLIALVIPTRPSAEERHPSLPQ